MRLPACLAAWLLATCATAHARNYNERDYFSLHLHRNADPRDTAQRLGLQLEGQVGNLAHHYTFSCPKGSCQDLADSLKEFQQSRKRRRRSVESAGTLSKRQSSHDLSGILWSGKHELRQRHAKRIPLPPPGYVSARAPQKAAPTEADTATLEELKLRLNTIVDTLDIQDPTFKEQWHLFNILQPGHDLNVTGVWLQGITGNGSISAIVDDGLDFQSTDILDNYYAAGSWDFSDPGPDPLPRLYDDKHGTRCAGEIAAVKNDVCGVGMAYDSQIAGIRILSRPISDEDEAVAMNYHYQENDIYSCSWGPTDDGKSMEAPGLLIQRAIVNGVQNGRDGLGSIFVFAAGNGAAADDNCNFDGYTNSIYSITVGGIDRYGAHPYYSEACSAQLVVTYSSGHNDAIHTTDTGVAQCVATHGGTSAAGPLVAGTIALALSARPELSWRDVQYLCVETAIPINEDDGDWQNTTIGHRFSHQYGYGKVDAYQFVELAKSWDPVKPQAWYYSPWLSVQHQIPQGNQGLTASYEVTDGMIRDANIERLEHVAVTMNVEHGRRGDLSADLISPNGVVSHLATSRSHDDEKAGYDDWTFMSVAHWGESGAGTWTVVLKDSHENEFNGTFVDWRLTLWGESIDATVQTLHPLPDEHDDDHETASAIVSTTSVEANLPATGTGVTVPTDHPNRPTKPKPTASTDSVVIVTATNTISVPAVTETATQTSSTAIATATSEPEHTYSDSFLPSFFPTFGVSKRTQIWIYGSLGLIVVFCAGLATYFVVQRRKRLRNDPRGYEFEMVGDEDEDEQRGLTSRGGRRSGRAKRGGELYDAFAAGDSDSDLFSDDGSYQDTPSNDTGTGSSAGSSEGREKEKSGR